MTIACDRCGETVAEMTMRPLSVSTGSGKLPRRANEVDLCEPCLKEFRAWLGSSAVVERGEDDVF